MKKSIDERFAIMFREKRREIKREKKEMLERVHFEY